MNEKYMRRAIDLAKLGEGHVNPNPLVGAVIVMDDEVIAEGYHHQYGDLHAERDALSKLDRDATGAEMYVTLEPCCHYGKQPPCTEAIIQAGISKVYVGSSDPNPLIAGKGLKMLEMAGIEVVSDVLKDECDALNPIFFHYISTHTPYVIMKYAMTMDGKIAAYTGKSQWITGEHAREHVQHTRNMCMGIMVGIGTVLADNPKLTCRLPGGRNPVRIVCDSHLSIPIDSYLVQTAREVPLYVATMQTSGEKMDALENLGVRLMIAPEKNGHVDIADVVRQLGDAGIDSILLEGGGTLNYSMLEAGLVNRVQVYIAPKILGGDGRFTPVKGLGVEDPSQAYCYQTPTVTTLGSDILLEYERKKEGV